MGFREIIADAEAIIRDTFCEETDATYTQIGHAPVILSAILTNPSELTESGGVTRIIASAVPVIEIVQSDLGGITPKKGDTIALGGNTYKVETAHPDGYGMTKLNVAVIA